mgnify:FL=1|tara:strand:+ start:7156 stop:8181 length:1026 start_codon:yes stop_codon:yes gene_type:complete
MAYLNPKSKEKFLRNKSQRLDIDLLAREIFSGNRTAIAQGLTLVENQKEETHQHSIQLISKLSEIKTDCIRVGITGVPGVGKSTFIEALGLHLVEQGNKVGVLAIDPSSQKTRGSILGDKTRMEQLSVNDNVFIRPSPSSGALGGVAKTTRESVTILEAAGYDVILIETVGVGQSETIVKYMVDFFLLLMIPGAGDELQGIKRGIMEMADGIAINKAEKSNRSKAKLAAKQFNNALHMFPLPDAGLTPFVETCSALHFEGIKIVWDSILNHINHVKKSKHFTTNRTEQTKFWLKEAIKFELENAFYNSAAFKDSETNLMSAEPFIKAKLMVDRFLNTESKE